MSWIFCGIILICHHFWMHCSKVVEIDWTLRMFPRNDHEDIVRCLLDAGANINACTAGGASPTYIAAQKGCMKALALLMGAPGVDANLSANDGATPILIAAQNGHQDAVRFLLEKKVDVTKAMKSGATALFVAAQNGYLKVAQDLVAANASLVNMCLHNGTSPFYVAAQNGHLDVLKYLQQERADTRKKSCGGASPFFIAAQNGHVTVVRFLLDVEWREPEVRAGTGSSNHVHKVSSFLQQSCVSKLYHIFIKTKRMLLLNQPMWARGLVFGSFQSHDI